MRPDVALSLGITLTLLPPALVVQAQTVDELFDQAEAAYNAGNYEESEQLIRELLIRNPHSAAAYNGLGTIFQAQGDIVESIEAYQRAVDLDPTFGKAYANLGASLFLAGDVEDAVDALHQAIEVDPEYASAFYNLGVVYQDQGELQKALESYRQAIELDPGNVETYVNLGNIWSDQGKLEDAIFAYSQAIEIDPEFSPAYYNLGIALFDQGSLEQALAAYLRLLQLPKEIPSSIIIADNMPSNIHASAYNNIGFIYQVQGDLDKAVQNYQKALDLDPDYVKAQNNLTEAERLLALQETPEIDLEEELAWLPDNEPLLPMLRAVVRVVAKTSSGNSVGTGWVVKKEDGQIWILTNRHVLTDENSYRLSENVEVEFFSEPPSDRVRLRLAAELIQTTSITDNKRDLALLTVDNAPDDIEPLEVSLGRASRRVRVSVVGHPSTGLPWTTDEAIISGLNASTLQLSVPLAPGNSGGPVLNELNQVVGMVYEASSPDQPGITAGYGFAYPIRYLQETLANWGIELSE